MSKVPRTAPQQPRAAEPGAANTGTRLLEAYRAHEDELFAAFERAGHGRLRRKHGAVLANVAKEGSRPSELASLARMTRPAMGELIDELAEMGYVRKIADPADRRAKRVVLTPRGLAVVRIAAATIRAIEERYRRILGPGRYRELHAMLAAISGDAPRET